MATTPRVLGLAKIIYSSGKVFDGLSTGRLDTENFLASGSLAGISSRADLALLEDLRDAATFIIEHPATKIDVAYLRLLNSTIPEVARCDPALYVRPNRLFVPAVGGVRHAV